MTKCLPVYESPGITITFDPDLCIHSGVCVRFGYALAADPLSIAHGASGHH